MSTEKFERIQKITNYTSENDYSTTNEYNSNKIINNNYNNKYQINRNKKINLKNKNKKYSNSNLVLTDILDNKKKFNIYSPSQLRQMSDEIKIIEKQKKLENNSIKKKLFNKRR